MQSAETCPFLSALRGSPQVGQLVRLGQLSAKIEPESITLEGKASTYYQRQMALVTVQQVIAERGYEDGTAPQIFDKVEVGAP